MAVRPFKGLTVRHILYIYIYIYVVWRQRVTLYKVQIKHSLYRRGQDLRVPRQSAHEGGKVVSPMHRMPLPPGNVPGTHFWERLSWSQGHSADSEAGRIMSMKNSNDTIGNQTHNFPAFTAVPQPTVSPRDPVKHCIHSRILDRKHYIQQYCRCPVWIK